jgi:hypothetical protein
MLSRGARYDAIDTIEAQANKRTKLSASSFHRSTRSVARTLVESISLRGMSARTPLGADSARGGIAVGMTRLVG